MTGARRRGLVSVVVPAFNAEKTIEETLRSIESQEAAEWEALVVDDGSTDSTAKILSRWAGRSSRFRILRHPEGRNLGVAASRNLGIRFASGEYLAFLDADDIWEPGALRILRRAIERFSDVAVVFGRSIMFGEAEGPRQAFGHGRAGIPLDVFPLLCRANPIVLSGTLVRAECLPEGEPGPFPVGLPFQFEDWALWLTLARSYPFLFVDETVVRYRLSSSSATSRMTIGDRHRRFHRSQASLLHRMLESEGPERKSVLELGLVYRSCDALRESASQLRRGRLLQAASWLKVAWYIAASPARFLRAMGRLPAEQRRVWAGKAPDPFDVGRR